MKYWKEGAAVVALLVATLFLSGWLGLGCFAAKYETTTLQYVVKSGDTMWEIGERYYPDNERRPFNEFMYDFRARNGFAPGSGRKHLQPGEILTITLEQRVR